MLQWWAGSGGRPKSDPPTGLAAGDIGPDDDDGPLNYRKAIGEVRSRRGRKKQQHDRTHLIRTSSYTESETASEEDHAKPVPEVFNFFEDDDVSRLSNMYELDGCGSMLYEAVAIRPQTAHQRRTSKSSVQTPWKKLLPSSKPRQDPDGMSPRTKLLKRMNGSVDAESISLRRREAIDPLPTEPPLPDGIEFDDQVLQSAMDIVAMNRSIKHHSSIKEMLNESDSSESPIPPRQKGRSSRGRNHRALSPLDEDAAMAPRRKKKDCSVDSDNSVLQFAHQSDVESSDVSLFQTLQRAMQVQRAGRPSPPASPLRKGSRRVEVASSMSLYAAIDSTLKEDPIIQSRTPKGGTPKDCRRRPAPEQTQLLSSGPKIFRQKPDSASPPRKRRITRRLQAVRSKHADGDSSSDESLTNDKYTSTWHKKQRVVSPAHSIASRTMDTRRVSNAKSRALPSRNRDGTSADRPPLRQVRTDIDTGRLLGREPAELTSTNECWDASPMSSLPPTSIWGSEMISAARAAGLNPRLPDCWKFNRVARSTIGRDDHVHVDDSDEEEPSKAAIQARGRLGLRVSSLVEDSSGLVTTDEEENGTKRRGPERRVPVDLRAPAKPSSGRSMHSISPEVFHADQSRRLFTPPPFSERSVDQVEAENGAAKEEAENGIPSPVHSVEEPELELLSFLSGDCGGEAAAPQNPGLIMNNAGPKKDSADCWSPRGHGGWAFFHTSDSHAHHVLNSVRDESRHSPLLLPHHRRPARPPKPEKRKSRDCRPDLSLSGPQQIDAPAKNEDTFLGDCDILSVLSRDSLCDERQTSGQTPRLSRPPKPEKRKSSNSRPSQFPRSIRFGSFAEQVQFKPRMIAPGGRENPIFIGDHHRPTKSQLNNETGVGTVHDQCHAITSLSRDCDYQCRSASLVVDPLQLGGSRNPIVITDANVAISEVLNDEKSILHSSVEGNRARGDFVLSNTKPQIVEDVTVTSSDGSSNCENQPTTRLTNEALTLKNGCGNIHAATPVPPPSAHPVFVDEMNDQELRIPSRTQGIGLRDEEGLHQLGAEERALWHHQAQLCTRAPVPSHRDANYRSPASTWSRIPEQSHLTDNHPVEVCGINHGPNNRSSMVHSSEHMDELVSLRTELERQLGTSNGVVLFKPTICIYSQNPAREIHSETCCGAEMPSLHASTAAPFSVGDNLTNISATITMLEEKALHVDRVLTSALELVEKRMFKERNSFPVEDDDGLGEEIDRLSMSETALRKELSELRGFSRLGSYENFAKVQARSKQSTPQARCVESPVTQSIQPNRTLDESNLASPKSSDRRGNSERLASMPTESNLAGVSAKFPVDLTHQDYARSTDLNCMSAASSAESDAPARDMARMKTDYIYDAVPPMQRLRDQARNTNLARNTKRGTNDRVSSILHLVGPHRDAYSIDQFDDEQDDETDFDVDPNTLVLHHCNHEDVEVVCLTEGGHESDESTEEIEVVFVEESFLSTDSFSFGETKGVYFDWKRSPDDLFVKSVHRGALERTNGSVRQLAQPLRRQLVPSLRTHPLKHGSTEARVSDEWRPKVVGALAENAVERFGEGAPGPSSSKREQEELVDKVIHVPITPAVVGSPRMSLSDLPRGNDRNASRLVASPHSPAVRRNDGALESWSGILSDVFSGLEDSVKQSLRKDDESSGSLRRRVEAITRRSERSKRNDVVLLESRHQRQPRQEGLPPSSASSSMMDDDEESLLSLTLSVASQESVNSKTCLVSVASADAEAKLKDILARGKKLVRSDPTTRSKGVLDLNRGEKGRAYGQEGPTRPSTTFLPVLKHGSSKEADDEDELAPPVKTLPRGRHAIRPNESNSIDELSDWDSSQTPDVSAEAFKSPPLELVAEIQHLAIPRAACKISGKPPIAACPASRRLLRLRRLQDNWTLSKSGRVMPRQGHTKPTETKPSLNGRFPRTVKRFSKLSSSNGTVDSCSTLTPSVRRNAAPTRHLAAMRMSRLFSRELNATSMGNPPSMDAVLPDDSPLSGPRPAHTTEKKAMLGRRHVSKESPKSTPKTTVSPAPTPRAPSTHNPVNQGATASPVSPVGSPISPVGSPTSKKSLSKLMKKLSPSSFSWMKKKTPPRSPWSPVRQHGILGSSNEKKDEKLRQGATTQLRSPPPSTNPFESHLGQNMKDSPAIFFPEDCFETVSVVAAENQPTVRPKRLHLSRIPDFPDLLHPSLRSVGSYPPMSSTKATSPRSLKGSLPPFVRTRNSIAALPGSLLWAATHGSSDEEF